MTHDRSTDPDAPVVLAAISAVRSGDRDAFARIVAIYQRRLFGLIYMMTRDASGAEEVAQDAFVRAFSHLRAYDSSRPFYPWLATIGVRLAQNWLARRQRQVRREGVALETEHEPAGTDPDPLSAVIARQRDRDVWDAVASLPSGERTAVLLHYRQGLSVGEAADVVGVAGGTIKTLLFRARKKLRHRLAGAGIGEEPS